MMTDEQVLQKMEEDFLLRGYAENTMGSYHNTLKRFQEFAGTERMLADLGEKDLRAFLLHLHKEGNLQGTSINAYNAGCKFFLCVVLNLPINKSQVPNVRAKHKLPVYFRVEQLQQFFAHLNDIKEFAFFLTLYGTGMRTSELRRLKCAHIETDTQSGVRLLRIPHAKRNRERRVILPEPCYQALRLYWRQYRPETPENWMFPAKKITGCLKYNVSSNAFKTCVKRSRLPEEFHPHSLRHSHSLNFIQHNRDGILTLKNILGHARLASTEVYLNCSMVDTTNKKSPAQICEMLWEQYEARHVDTPTL